MKLGIGIDTGGTYTDAVIYDFESGKVLAGAKSLTTRDDLSVGIGGALDNLPADLLRQARLASLSTTLATNACVEGKGGRAKLLFIGVGRDTLDRVGADYGISEGDSLFFLDAAGSFDGKELPEIDWDKLLDDAAEWMTDADGLGVVELYAMKNGAVIEKKAKELFSERYGVSVICGSELFNGLNSVRRGAGTLLNAKLVPIIAEFMQAIGRAFAARGVNAPVMIVRSDGSLMSEKFARLRPVETILCGPAASVLGGRALAGRENAVIVDMGGTTTDISIVKNGMPVRATDGISIGAWRTFVRGVFIDTFGLGGDSAVRVEGEGIKLETRRVAPISLIARDHPEILPYLEELAYKEHTHTQPIHEFYTLVREPEARARLTPAEEKLVDALRGGPLPLKEFAAAAGTNVYHLETARLENEGYLLRCGMTPTDAMHLRGDFEAYDPEAARLTAVFMMRCLGIKDEGRIYEFCDMIYDAVKRKLYDNLVRILLHDRFPKIPTPTELIDASWDAFKRGERPFFDVLFTTRAALVGIGAPTHIFLPDVARALGAECIIPENAGVTNAVGAIVGSVSVTAQVEIRPNHHPGGIDGYTVFSDEGNYVFKERAQAEEKALELAEKQARAEAARRGVTGDLRVSGEIIDNRANAGKYGTVDLGGVAEATVTGGTLL